MRDRHQGGGCLDMSDIDDEANAFAMELLMPTEFLLADLKAMGSFDIEDPKPIRKLAQKYNVSEQAMLIRIARLPR
jgi:Zn-dependent peptidase ImmA (M78 family)